MAWWDVYPHAWWDIYVDPHGVVRYVDPHGINHMPAYSAWVS